MPLNREEVLYRIHHSLDPSGTARMYGKRGGRSAHRVQDVFNNKGPGLYVRTPAHGWHIATPRELDIMRNKNRNQTSGAQSVLPKQMVLNFS